MNTKNVNRMKKEELVEELKGVMKHVKDKSLKDSISYTIRNAASATKRDLLDLIKEVGASIATQNVTPVAVENSIKKPSVKSKKGVKRADEVTAEDVAVTEEKPVKKPVKKTASKSSATKKKETGTSAVFPLSLKDSDLGDMKVADDIKTMDDLLKCMENGERIVFAMLWTKKQLRQFNYLAPEGIKVPSQFPEDLDICNCIYIAEGREVAYCVSSYTEAVYTVLPKDLEVIDGCRYTSGCEFEIYRAE